MQEADVVLIKRTHTSTHACTAPSEWLPLQGLTGVEGQVSESRVMISAEHVLQREQAANRLPIFFILCVLHRATVKNRK